MATKKQRRRRDKGRRHEYEYVYVDEEGRELDVDETGVQPRKDAPARTGKSAAGTRRTRAVQPPSWRRVGKRALIFAPLMYLTVTVLDNGQLSAGGRVAQTVLLLLVFLPASYVMDSVTYRIWRKRTGAGPDPG